MIAAFLLSAATAQASPKDKDAKKMFDKGVAAYTKGDYAAASAALSESYAREGDAETLFAWAQSEKKLGHCANAVELYNTLLAFDLPVENKKVIEGQLAECKQPEDKKTERIEKEKAEKAAKAERAEKEKAEKAERDKAEREKAEKKDHTETVAQVEEPIDTKPEVHASSGARPWWKDPVGDAFVVTGAIGLGIGTVMLVSAHSADQDKTSPGITYTKYKSDLSTAHDDGLYGVVGLVAGSALIFSGVAWYATHKDHSHAVTGFVAPTGGGIALSGSF